MIATPAVTAPHAVAATAPVVASLPANTPLEEAQKTANTSHQGQQNLRNAHILEASMQVSIQAGNEGLALLYRTAVDAINSVLDTELGPQAIQNASGQDNSSEGTAGRIVAFSTAMFDAYAARYPDKDMAEVAKDFIHVIRGGFEQGYKEAEDILNSLGVLPDVQVVAQGMAKTFDLVHKGYADWLTHKISTLPTPRDSATASADAT